MAKPKKPKNPKRIPLRGFVEQLRSREHLRRINETCPICKLRIDGDHETFDEIQELIGVATRREIAEWLEQECGIVVKVAQVRAHIEGKHAEKLPP